MYLQILRSDIKRTIWKQVTRSTFLITVTCKKYITLKWHHHILKHWQPCTPFSTNLKQNQINTNCFTLLAKKKWKLNFRIFCSKLKRLKCYASNVTFGNNIIITRMLQYFQSREKWSLLVRILLPRIDFMDVVPTFCSCMLNCDCANPGFH